MTVHVPILLEPIIETLLKPFWGLSKDAPPHWMVDCTLGGGGHTAGFLREFEKHPELNRHRVLSIDRDLAAIERARKRFDCEIKEGRLVLAHSSFQTLPMVVGQRPVLGVLADIGVSSDQLDEQARGFSFLKDAPLDMRMDLSEGQTCAEYLAQVSQRELERVLKEYGEERFAQRIAGSILEKKTVKTKELVDAVVRAVPSKARHGRIHVATRTFQALRIAVNGEMDQLDALLKHVIIILKPSGRAGIMSFHSLEDRRVKQFFRQVSEGDSAEFELLNKKPFEPGDEETARNPRARSAKLRFLAKKT